MSTETSGGWRRIGCTGLLLGAAYFAAHKAISGVVLTCVLIVAALPIVALLVQTQVGARGVWVITGYFTVVAFAHAVLIEPVLGRALDRVFRTRHST